MTDDRVDFSSILASRLCHDLLSPVGAFANGLELLGDEQDPDMRARCIELLEQSAKASATKLKFFRLAFGSAGGFGQDVPAAEVRAAVNGLVAERQIDVNWMIGEMPLSRPAVKVILNLSLILSDALVRGGRLSIGCEQRDDVTEIALHAEADRILIDADIERLLKDGEGAAEMTSRTAPAALVCALAARHEGQVMLSREAPRSVVVGAILRG